VTVTAKNLSKRQNCLGESLRGTGSPKRAPGEAWEIGRRCNLSLKLFIATQRVIDPSGQGCGQPEPSVAQRWGKPFCEAYIGSM
jgi:hypothetical protein